MSDRNDFLDKLRVAVDQAKINDGKISTDEIKELFEEDGLSAEQLSRVYEYLRQSNISVEGEEPGKKAKAERKPEETKKEGKKPVSESKIIKMYMDSLKAHEKMAQEEERAIVAEILSGDYTSERYEEYINRKLHFVVSRARRLAIEGEVLEELIQEGNLGLLSAMERIRSGEFDRTEDAVTNALELMRAHVDAAMQSYIDSIYESESEEKSMVAKVNFVSEAAKQLKEENGTEPNLKELAAYTNMDEEELLSIINLSADALKAD